MMSERTPHGAKSGIEKYLNDEEEDILATFLLKCAAIAGLSTFHWEKKSLLSLAQRFCNSRDMDV